MPIFHGNTIGQGVVLNTPSADGTAGQVITTDGSGNLSFVSTYADTVADMLALTPTDGDMCQTLGYTTLGDKGANLYRFKNTTGLTIDGGITMPGYGGVLGFDASHVFDGTAGTGFWLAVETEKPSPHQFGCISDGATDDLDPLQRFVNYVIVNEKSVKFTGKFAISDTLYIKHPTSATTAVNFFELEMPLGLNANAFMSPNMIGYIGSAEGTDSPHWSVQSNR